MQAKPPWWERISAALKHLHATAIEIDGQTYALSCRLTRDHRVIRFLNDTGVVLESHRLDRHYPDPALRDRAKQRYNRKKRLSSLSLFQLDPKRADEINRWCLMSEPELRVRLTSTGLWRLEPEEPGNPDFTWYETHARAS